MALKTINFQDFNDENFKWVEKVQPEKIDFVKYQYVFYLNHELLSLNLKTISSFFSYSSGYIRKIFLIIYYILTGKSIFFTNQKIGIVFNAWSNNYFHWFTEVVPRILEFKNKNADILFIFPFQLNKQYQSYSLDLIGVKYKQLDSLLIFGRELFFSQSSRKNTGHFLPNQFSALRNLFLKVNKKSKNVYIRRSGKKRQIVNDQAVSNIFLLYGFVIVELENLSLKDQINLFSEVHIIASIHGAALTNMLFMNEGGKVIEFVKQYEKFDKCYYNMAKSLDFAYFYIPCIPLQKTSTYSDADLVVNIEMVKQLLDSLKNKDNNDWNN